MEILGKLGIDIKILVAQIINFGLLLWLLKKFLYTSIVRRIEKDERELNEARTQKEKLADEQEEFQKQKTKELKDAREKAESIVAEAEAMAEKIKKRARKETEEDKRKVMVQIQARLKDIEHEKNK